MRISYENVNKYFFGFIKVITKVEQWKNHIVNVKEVYFIGMRVFRSSESKERTVWDKIVQETIGFSE